MDKENHAPNASLGAAPPIVAPDRVSTTRMLLQDVQACIQKFSARMDALSAGVEQNLRDVQMCKATLENSGEKTVADIADVGESIEYKAEGRLYALWNVALVTSLLMDLKCSIQMPGCTHKELRLASDSSRKDG